MLHLSWCMAKIVRDYILRWKYLTNDINSFKVRLLFSVLFLLLLVIKWVRTCLIQHHCIWKMLRVQMHHYLDPHNMQAEQKAFNVPWPQGTLWRHMTRQYSRANTITSSTGWRMTDPFSLSQICTERACGNKPKPVFFGTFHNFESGTTDQLWPTVPFQQPTHSPPSSPVPLWKSQDAPPEHQASGPLAHVLEKLNKIKRMTEPYV